MTMVTALDTTAITRKAFIRTGPRRGWYLLAALLWVAGWLGLFSYGYAEQDALGVDARSYPHAGIGGAVRFTAPDPGRYAVWLQVKPGIPRGDRLAGKLREPRFLPALVAGPGGSVVAHPATVRDYRTTGGPGQLGYAVAQFEARRGQHQVLLPGASSLARDKAVIGFAVGPAPEPASRTVLVSAGVVVMTGLVLGAAVFRRRARARKTVILR